MKNGSLTFIGVIFLSVVSLIVGYQLIVYGNYQRINNNLISGYKLKIKSTHYSLKMNDKKKSKKPIQ